MNKRDRNFIVDVINRRFLSYALTATDFEYTSAKFIAEEYNRYKEIVELASELGIEGEHVFKRFSYDDLKRISDEYNYFSLDSGAFDKLLELNEQTYFNEECYLTMLAAHIRMYSVATFEEVKQDLKEEYKLHGEAFYRPKAE